MVEGRRKKEGGRSFGRLIAWQKADELASSIFQGLPKDKIPPWLAAQVMRAAVSVPANIAEGYARGALKDYLRFLDIARGSLAEVDYYLNFMRTNGLLDGPAYERLAGLHSDTGNLLVALIRSLRPKLENGSWHRVSEEFGEYLIDSNPSSSLPSSSDLLPGGEA